MNQGSFNNNRGNSGSRRYTQRSQNITPQATPPMASQSLMETPVFSNEAFPPLFAATASQQTNIDASSSNKEQHTASSMYEQQPKLQGHALQSSSPMSGHGIRPVLRSTHQKSRREIVKDPTVRENFPVIMQSYTMSGRQPATTGATNLVPSVTMKPSNVPSGNNPSAQIQRPLSPHEQVINTKLCEIILTIHKSKEFVSRESVQQELFNHFRVGSWHDLRVHPSRFNALINLTDRQKDVTFYMQVFEQTFNLCTLHDLEALLARFLKVEKYEEVLLGPLEKNPEVRRVFEYEPSTSDQPIPLITAGNVIKKFIDFQGAHRQKQRVPFEDFLERLVETYELQTRKELGIFCKSFPFLVQTTGTVRRDHDWYLQQVNESVRKELIDEAREHLDELKEKLKDESQLSSFNKKKTPTAVFNYLTSIVDKYLPFVPQQPALYAVLVQLRDNELLRCLFNMSIYLGTIDKPEVFIAELQKLYGYEENNPHIQKTMTMPAPLILNDKMSKKDRKRMNAMIQQKQPASQSSDISVDGQNLGANTASAMPVNTSFASSLFATHPSKPKPPVPLKELCLYVNAFLNRYDTILTIKQLLKVDEHVCDKYSVPNFSIFSYDDNDNNDNPANLISFLDKYRQTIDPHGELSIYDQTISTDDQAELYSFVHQLSVIYSNEINEGHQQEHMTSIHGDVNTDQIHISAEKLSAVEKAIKHKFGGLTNFRKVKQIIKKVKQRHHRNAYSIIHYEESLLDVNGLNRLDICPTSLSVDETQLCKLILNCPLMIDLYTWFQWFYFFQPKYGTLKSFLIKHEHDLKDLRLLETSTRELFRLPTDANLSSFEQELDAMRVRSAVGHLCTVIIQEGLVTRFSFNVYQTSMDAWFLHLRSLATLHNDLINPMQYILDFLMYLPVHIGQSRIVAELILGPLDKVFGNDSGNLINSRTRIWNLADAKQKEKLELWGHIINVMEWKNERKWLGHDDLEEIPIIKIGNDFIKKQTIDQVFSVPLITTGPESPSVVISNPTSITPMEIPFSDADDSARAAFEHIESIRRGLGVDSGLDANGQSIIANLQGVIKRSIDKLSNDLYSDEGHFVLELIQNADDNQYAPDRLPTLRFTLSPERILVCNNEIGFQPNNIAAICNVGDSTKGKHKQGYAGHKGIGFKSVFMVSHRPEIHSRNYHLRFDTAEGKDLIGYIRPLWLDQYEEVLPNPDEWMTCIRLPIKSEKRGDSLQQNFNDIQARLLLFLNRLRRIEIVSQQEISSNRVFTRIDHAHGEIIELQEKATDGTMINNFWLVIKKVIEIPADVKLKLRDVKGDITSTTIAIAYPLSGIRESSSQLPPTQPLFAYLPLRSYGFRFILQADFEIPATRQEVRRDNLWNEWLKAEMTQLLYLAYLKFQHLPELLASSSIITQINDQLTSIQTIKYFLKLIPSRNELDPYFNTFVDKSIQLLTGFIELPVSCQNEKDETVIEWVKPSKCVIVRDPFIRKILSQDLLLSHFNSYYVHEQLVLECDEQILLKLGCRQLDFLDITTLIEASYKQDEQEHPKTTAAIEQIAQWLVCLDYSLQQQREQMQFHNDHDEKREEETIVKLREMKIIPLRQHSRLVSINEFDKNGIYFPLDKSTDFSKHLKLLLDDVPTLDEHLISFIDDKYPRRVDSINRLLQKLGVTEARNIREIYRQHILPIMSDPSRWSSKSESVLMAYLLCIYDYIYLPNRDQFENELKQLQSKTIIKTRDNKFLTLGSDVVVHLTLRYGCRRSLENLKSSKYQLNFISDDYFNQYRKELFSTDTKMYSFVSFLKELNMDDFLQVNAIDTPFIDVSKLVDTQWAYLIPQLRDSIHEPFIIKDFRCDEFNKLVSPSDENQTADLELCIQLLQYLHNYHRSISMNYAASIVLARGNKYNQVQPIQAVESSFCLALRQHAWIPVVGDKLFIPSDVYLLSSNSETAAFQRYVPHLDVSKVTLTDQDFIINILGIKPQVTPRIMFELLMKWSCDLDSKSLWNLMNQTNTFDAIPCTLPTTFRQTCLDTIDNFHQIYRFLASNDETRQLLSRFRLWPLIFIPRDSTNGTFLFVHQTFWNDPISLLSLQDTIADTNGRIPLGPHYDNDPLLQPFFLNILHVQLQPTIDDYLPLLSTVQDNAKIWLIIEIITKLTVEQNKQNEVREKFVDLAFIPCMNNTQKLMKYTDHPFYPHDTDIADLFADTLPIIKLPILTLSTSFQEHFCLLFNIENLSKVIQTKVDVEKEEPSTSLLNFYSSSIDLIQHFLLNQGLISEARSTHLSTVFARMHFICVDRIQLSYCYGTDIIKSTPNSYGSDTYIGEESGKFYILKKYENNEMRYIDAMAEFIVEDETIRSKLSKHIKLLLNRYEKDPEQGLTKVRESLTGTYEPKWTIPEEIKEEIPILPPVQEEKAVPIKPVIAADEIEKLKTAPSRRPERRPQEVPKEGDEKPLISFPQRAGAIESINPAKTKPNDSTEREQAPSSSESSSTDQNHRDREQTNNEHVVPKHESSRHTDGDSNIKQSTEDETKPPSDQPHAPISLLDINSTPPANFEHIEVSTINDLDLFTSNPSTDEESITIPFRPIATESDIVTGRLGEKFIFDYLRWKNPNVDIKWMNEDEESYAPYDIRMVGKSDNDRDEFIEVKTTRSYDQNTFAVSIGEVEYFLRYPSNYHIYRLYYADNKELSTITVISKIKDNLKLKHLKLSMTVIKTK